jgi:hypothetical protein
MIAFSLFLLNCSHVRPWRRQRRAAEDVGDLRKRSDRTPGGPHSAGPRRAQAVRTDTLADSLDTISSGPKPLIFLMLSGKSDSSDSSRPYTQHLFVFLTPLGAPRPGFLSLNPAPSASFSAADRRRPGGLPSLFFPKKEENRRCPNCPNCPNPYFSGVTAGHLAASKVSEAVRKVSEIRRMSGRRGGTAQRSELPTAR